MRTTPSGSATGPSTALELRSLTLVGSSGGTAHTVEWNGRDAAGRAVAPGLYLYRLETSLGVAVGKMLLTK